MLRLVAVTFTRAGAGRPGGPEGMPYHRLRGAALAALLVTLLLPPAPAAAATVVVDALDHRFEPPNVTVGSGDTVTWINKGRDVHTATAVDGSFDHYLRPGDEASSTFTEAGSVPYYCKLHGSPGGFGMAGSVEVEAEALPSGERLAADDNVGAAIAWSRRTFDDGGADTALLARDDVFADALASGPLQGARSAPLLLTASDRLDERTRAELERLGVDNVLLLGGPEALAPSVEDELAARYRTARLAGSYRVTTAIAVAAAAHPDATTAVIARAFGDSDPTRAFADSLAAGSFAAITEQPVLLSTSDRLSPHTAGYLRERGITDVTLVGGTEALSEQVEADIEALGVRVDRADGSDRVDTAAQLFARAFLDDPPQTIAVVDGFQGRAWAAGFPAASARIPVLLTAGADLPAVTTAVLVLAGPERPGIVCGPFVDEEACRRAAVAATAAGGLSPEGRSAVLTGSKAVPPGNPEGYGIASIYPTGDPATLCYDYFAVLPEPVTAAHIHRGAEGTVGSPLVALSTTPGPFGHPAGCAFELDRVLVADILDNPRGYYVNVHSAGFPDGALRDQLWPITRFLPVQLDGGQVLPGPGDPDGAAFGAVVSSDDPNELCTVIHFEGLSSEPTTAHLHEARAGENGPPVLTLTITTDGSPPTCHEELDAALVQRVKDDPDAFYLDVHTAAHPDGAVRGQLAG